MQKFKVEFFYETKRYASRTVEAADEAEAIAKVKTENLDWSHFEEHETATSECWKSKPLRATLTGFWASLFG